MQFSQKIVPCLWFAGEAEEAARSLIEKRPSYRQSSVREELFFCPNERLLERFEEGLRQAGIPA